MEEFRMAKKKEPLVVTSKAKAYIKSKKMKTASEAVDAINDAVYSLLDDAISRAKKNKRSTIRSQDL